MLAAGMAVGGTAALAPAASASIGTPTLALNPSTATAASTANLGTDITFAPSGGDSVKNLTLVFPPGLIANASVDGGACLTSATPQAACVVGTGTVTATENSLLGASLSLPAQFTLVKPPAAGDLAGLAVSVKDPVSGQYTPLGTPAAVSLRGSGDPAGVGLDIAFTNIPDTYPVLGTSTSISVTEINGTFNGMRFPSSCPATAASIAVSATSYADATVRTATAPLTVTGCATAPFSPALTVSAARDSGDKEVRLDTDITQGAGEATSRSVKLTLPTDVLAANLSVIALVCQNPASGTCTAIGSATASSPVYPTPLSGKVYVTGTPGSLSTPGMAIVFPAPFPLTLPGTVDLATNSTTFSGVPDVPLSDLKVQLNGGPEAVFATSCATPSGTASTTLVSQNGDRTVTATAPFTVANCAAHAGGSGGNQPSTKKSTPTLSGARMWGLLRGHAALAFTVASASNGAKLKVITVRAPQGLAITRRRVHGKLRITGVSLRGAHIRSLAVSGGQLRITLRSATRKATVTVGAKALSETRALRGKAQHGKLKSLRLTVAVRDAVGKTTTLRTVVKRLGLA
jgi:hypothetical protein